MAYNPFKTDVYSLGLSLLELVQGVDVHNFSKLSLIYGVEVY